jgi:uncharacterized membrane protein
MPEITLLGWFHTICGILSIIIVLYVLFQYKLISFNQNLSRLYLFLTFITAFSSLLIYNQGGFGIAHILGILTLSAVLAGIFVEKTLILGWMSKYFYTLCYTSTFLFHMIPAITDGLRRLPVNDPIARSFSDPIIVNFHILFFIIYLVILFLQFRKIKGNNY